MKPYRKNVGIVVFNAQGRVLAGERLSPKGAMQYPQGGLDKDEEPEIAARRELYEEVGLQLSGPPAGEIQEWLYYDFPATMDSKRMNKYQGQQQKWYFYFWDGDQTTLSLDHHQREFSRVIWTDPDLLAREIVEFKRPVYERVRDEARSIIARFLEQRASGQST